MTEALLAIAFWIFVWKMGSWYYRETKRAEDRRTTERAAAAQADLDLRERVGRIAAEQEAARAARVARAKEKHMAFGVYFPRIVYTPKKEETDG